MRAWLCVLWFVSGLLPAMAAEEFAASFRLRGGYDSNPLLVPNGKGSALAAWEAAAVYGHDNGEWVTGATGEAALTRYREPVFEPIQNYRLRLRLANKNQNEISLDATTTLVHFSNYDTKSEFVNQRVHLQWMGGALRPFVAGDLRFASLNEANILLGNFLPEPMRYLRGTITPGVAYVRDKLEFGAQVALSRTRYEAEPDLFGFRRNNDRAEPGVFAKFNAENFSASGAVSFLRAHSEEQYFTDVEALLFDVSLAAKWQGWSGELSASRTAEDTTFPVSPVTINTTVQAKLGYDIAPKTNAGVFLRSLKRKYWDTPLFSRTEIAGVEFMHEIRDDVSLAGQLGFAKATLLTGEKADGMIASLSLMTRFAAPPKK